MMKISQLTAAAVTALICGACVARAADAADTRKPDAGATETAKPFKNVDVAQFDKLRGDKKTVVLDVRTGSEFAAGHIPGAININVNASDFTSRVAQLDKSKTYLVHCAAGVRSVKACNKLAPLKFEHLYNLEGGFSAWEKAGKPVEK